MTTLPWVGALTLWRMAELCVCCAIITACVVLAVLVEVARPYAIIALVVTLVYTFRLWRFMPYERHREAVASAMYAHDLLKAGFRPESAPLVNGAAANSKEAPTTPTAAPISTPPRLHAQQREPTYVSPSASVYVRVASPARPRSSSRRETKSRGGSLVGTIHAIPGNGAAAAPAHHAPYGNPSGPVPPVPMTQPNQMPSCTASPYVPAPRSVACGMPVSAYVPRPYRGECPPHSVSGGPAAPHPGRSVHFSTPMNACLPPSMPRPAQGPGYARPPAAYRSPYG